MHLMLQSVNDCSPNLATLIFREIYLLRNDFKRVENRQTKFANCHCPFEWSQSQFLKLISRHCKRLHMIFKGICQLVFPSLHNLKRSLHIWTSATVKDVQDFLVELLKSFEMKIWHFDRFSHFINLSDCKGTLWRSNENQDNLFCWDNQTAEYSLCTIYAILRSAF